MKLVYTEQAIISLRECLDFSPSEVPPEKVNEVRDRILAKADKLLDNPYLGNLKSIWNTWDSRIEELLKVIIKSSTRSKEK